MAVSLCKYSAGTKVCNPLTVRSSNQENGLDNDGDFSMNADATALGLGDQSVMPRMFLIDFWVQR
jgi:hypothetical protein